VRLRRFTVLAATGVAAASIPVGFQVAQWSGPSAAPPAGQPPAPSAVSPTTPTPSTAVPSQSPAARAGGARTGATGFPFVLKDFGQVLYDVPDEVAVPGDEFPVPMVLLSDLGQYRAIPTVPGQACNQTRFEKLPQPVAGRSWLWAEEPTNRLDQYTVALNVTGWQPGAAQRELANVAKDAGACRFGDAGARSVDADPDGWSGWSRRPDGIYSGYAVRRLDGDVIVAVSVDSPVSRKDALAAAQSLAVNAVARARNAGLDKRLSELLAPAASPPATGVTPAPGR
jgi:hypothetical protein